MNINELSFLMLWNYCVAALIYTLKIHFYIPITSRGLKKGFQSSKLVGLKSTFQSAKTYPPLK